MKKKNNRPKFIEEVGYVKGLESMKASQMRPTTFKDRTKYSRKVKHKNHQGKLSGDFFMNGMSWVFS